ncbi:sugar ABC transporter substrate-binding protein [Buchananella hordeovulneris]|uniref:sugar ABC transporter substrate-binding protein n=1 Tax=Buchananella hordeovulneris TaxID=52770 RepID=UPI000F5D7D9E|nr:extracellular solute-binding protein [Buchananella hordeovulneris]RRD45026.1 extracellular solute-binding protein [Buchananella hordeovulneris]
MRRSIATISAVGLAFTLAACGGTGEAKTETAAPSEAATTAESAAPSDDTAGAEGGITIWADDTRYESITEFSKGFTEKFGAPVEVVKKSPDDIAKEFIAAVPTGKGPDIVITAHDRLGGFVTNGVVGTVDITGIKDNFLKSAVDGVTYDGQTYGVPYAIENIALIRNNKLTQAEPKTFDEMVAAGKESGAKFPFMVQQGENSDPYHMYPFQSSFGASVFKQNADGSYSPELNMGGEAGAKFATWLGEQGAAKNFDISADGEIAKQAFLAGETPFIVTGPWNLKAFLEAGLDVSVINVPQAGDQPAQAFVGVQAFFPSAKTDNPLVVNQYLTEYVGSEEGAKALYELDKRIPAYKKLADSLDDKHLAGFAAFGSNSAPMPALPQMDAVWDHWGKAEAAIIKGTADPAATWEQMVNTVAEAIKK